MPLYSGVTLLIERLVYEYPALSCAARIGRALWLFGDLPVMLQCKALALPGKSRHTAPHRSAHTMTRSVPDALPRRANTSGAIQPGVFVGASTKKRLQNRMFVFLKPASMPQTALRPLLSLSPLPAGVLLSGVVVSVVVLDHTPRAAG